MAEIQFSFKEMAVLAVWLCVFVLGFAAGLALIRFVENLFGLASS